jgi:hypothetical protein
MPDPGQYPLMVAKLKEMLSGDNRTAPVFGTPAYAQMMLTGIPLERVAESLNLRYLHEAHKSIAQLSVTRPDWDSSRWILICSSWVFEDIDKIDGVAVQRTDSVPPWSVLLLDVTIPPLPPIPFGHEYF